MAMVRRIAKEGAAGRFLAVNTTNLDTGQMQPWDVTQQANLAVQAGNTDRVIQVLLASSAIPGAFPPREIDGGLYVDGFVTGNILFSGRATRSDSDTFIARWKEKYPDIPPPKMRYWLIYNNQLQPQLQVAQPQWTAILGRTVDASSHASSVAAIQKLFMQTQIAHLLHGADVEVRYVAIPETWVQHDPTMFSSKTMNDLADIGERMGADPASWMTAPP
jgi:predicted acylesterase/phospholipase RssA